MLIRSKNLKLIITSLAICLMAFNAAAQQSFIKDCNELFDRDLKTRLTSFERSDFRSFLYTYVMSDEDQRQGLKKSRKDNTGLSAFIDGLPIQFSQSSETGSKAYKLYQMRMEAEQLSTISDGKINELTKEFVPESAFKSYTDCLAAGGKYLTTRNGVTAEIQGDASGAFVLKVSFSNTMGVDSVVIDAAIFSGCVSKFGNMLPKGKAIHNGQSVYQHLQRISGQRLNLTIAFRNKIDGVSMTLPAEVKNTNVDKVPVGTIIASVLDYSTFLDVNNDSQKNFDIIKSTWAPCDGRSVTGSKYGAKSTQIPDLRGLFIRGANAMGVNGAPPTNNEYLNPENLEAGHKQKDQFKLHSHKGNLKHGAEPEAPTGVPAGEYAANATGKPSPAWKSVQLVDESGGDETRPKNMTVYYYIRIN